MVSRKRAIFVSLMNLLLGQSWSRGVRRVTEGGRPRCLFRSTLTSTFCYHFFVQIPWNWPLIIASLCLLPVEVFVQHLIWHSVCHTNSSRYARVAGVSRTLHRAILRFIAVLMPTSVGEVTDKSVRLNQYCVPTRTLHIMFLKKIVFKVSCETKPY